MFRWFLSGATLALVSLVAGAQIVAVPPAANRSAAAARVEASTTLLTPANSPKYTIALSVPSAGEQAQLQQRSAATGGPALHAKRQVRVIGFNRALPNGNRSITLAGLSWQTLPDGGKAAQIRVNSPGAAAIRLGLSSSAAPSGVAVRFAGAGSEVYGPYAASNIAQERTFWSPVLDGETATMEIYLPPGVAPEAADLRLVKISHLVSAGASLAKMEPVSDIGRSESCEVDIACVATPAATNQARSVAKLVFTDIGGTFLCTGTLVNDSAASNTPYMYTAAHCMDSQEAASSLVTYWFFDAMSCGNRAVPPYATVTGGARLLSRSLDYDWALVQLNAPPPASAVFSAWRAEPLGNGTSIAVEHHPSGDLKKISQGTMQASYHFSDGTTFNSVRYSVGWTEAGSSGSGLLTFGSNGFYELRGGLFAGDGSCSDTSGQDVYSRLDIALAYLAPYLTPGAANPSQETLVVEYYYPGLDDYFITASSAEIQGLDSGAHPGWVRTGLTFLAYTNPSVAPADAKPVCRFYVLPQYGASHFYSADPAECAATAVKFAGAWVEESDALFYIQVPNQSGSCPANTRPVYRFVNKNNQIHHRYTAEIDGRDCMYYGYNALFDKDIDCTEFKGSWLEEGFGVAPNAPVMCAPAS